MHVTITFNIQALIAVESISRKIVNKVILCLLVRKGMLKLKCQVEEEMVIEKTEVNFKSLKVPYIKGLIQV